MSYAPAKCCILTIFVARSTGQDIYGRLPTPAVQPPAGQPQAAGPAPTPIAEHMGCLPTSAAVSLRLHAIDAAIVYQPGELPARETLPVPIHACQYAPALKLAQDC